MSPAAAAKPPVKIGRIDKGLNDCGDRDKRLVAARGDVCVARVAAAAAERRATAVGALRVGGTPYAVHGRSLGSFSDARVARRA
jgi:hypothetical protein